MDSTSLSCWIGSDVVSGKSTVTPWVSMGAVTIKITSSTSITSMQGTTLISDIGLRRCWGIIPMPFLPPLPFARCQPSACGLVVVVNPAMQDAGEFLREGLVVLQQSIRHSSEPVVGNNRRNRGKQTHGGGDQGFGNARRNRSQGCLLNLRQATEGIHDAPNGTEQAHVGTGGTHCGQERQMGFEPLLLPGESHTHGALGTFHDRICVPALLAQAGKFLETGPEHRLHTGVRRGV